MASSDAHSFSLDRWFHQGSSIMVAGEVRLSMKFFLLMLLLEVHPSPSDLSQARSSRRLTSAEVVVPLKVTGRQRGVKVLDSLSYSFQFGGQRHIVHMKVKKLLISRHLPVFTYTEQHVIHQDQPFVPDDCYYHGHVEGVPESLAALSTCSGGLRGMLQINDLAYEIEPISHSSTFEHWVYMINTNETEFPPMRCGVTKKETALRRLKLEEAEKSTWKQNSADNWWAHSWFLELVVVANNDFYVYSQSNVSKLQEDVFLVVNIVDSIYQQLGIYMILTGIEMWSHGNVFPMTSIDQILEDFSKWKQIGLSQLQYDAAHIFIKNSHIATLGIAYVAGICNPPLDCGVNNYQGDSWSLFALTVAHELGHTLGMQHDEEFCVCGQSGCIMYANRVLAERFTNCSYVDFMKTILKLGSCLHNPPSPEKVFMLKRCGNSVVEGEEECDCGNVQQCEQDPCCLLNCTLRPGAVCASGLCCKDCRLMPLGELCRQQTNECDLPEWCNGTSRHCPEDGYVQDGFPCSDSAYCYQKKCTNHDKQCKEIFGDGAKSASQNCYEEINSQGSRFGHCGINGTTYLKCNVSNIFCGRVQCQSVDYIPHLREHSVLQYAHINGVTCWGMDYHLGMDTPDAGEVKDGTMCGPQRICIHKRCVKLSVLPRVCLPETCNMKGICNNQHHCHCDYGWSPPYCLGRGYGGSIDSGPASARREVLLPLIVTCSLSLSLLLLAAILRFFQKHFDSSDTKGHSSD